MNVKKIVIGSVAGAVAVITLLASMTIVPAGYSGVVVTMGSVSDIALTEGFHFKKPYIQSVYDISNKIQVYETPADSVSKDLQAVSSTIAVNYRLASAQSAYIYQNVGTDYQTVLIAPTVQECMKAATAKYTAEQLITERAAVGDAVKEGLDQKLNPYGIYIEKFNIVNFDFSHEFNAAIEAKQVAEQNLLKTKTEQQEQITIAEAEAKKKVIAADAEAEATRTKAQADADAIQIKADAQADANQKISQSLTPEVLRDKAISQWDGVAPKITGSSDDFLFDIGELTE